MNARQTLAASLNLLNPHDRRVLYAATFAQMVTALLDLLGIFLVGVVSAMSIALVSDNPIPGPVSAIRNMSMFQNLSDASIIGLLATVAGVALISKTLLNTYITRRILRFLASRQAMVASDLAGRLLARPLIQVQQRSSQQTAYALTTGVNYATLTILGQGVIIFSDLALLIVLAIGLFAVSPTVMLATVAYFFAIAWILQRMMSGWARRLGSESANVEVLSFALVQEAMGTYREVVVSNRRHHYLKRFSAFRWDAAQVQSDLLFMGLVPKYVFEIALVVGAGLLALSQFLTRDVAAAVGVIAIVLTAGTRVIPSLMRIQTSTLLLRSSSGQAAPTFELASELRGGATIAISDNSAELVRKDLIRRVLDGHSTFSPRVTLVGVSYTYPGAREAAIREASLSLEPGRSLALAGPTGAGKSTLADLILGVATADSGEVKLGGISPLSAVANWPGAIAYVPQDTVIVNGSIRENVALGLPPEDIDDALVWEALDRAHLAPMLRQDRDGIETVVGENGVRLSGGQRQRLGVARALYTRPRLLVLDEATSALDAETEDAIAQTLRELEGVVTTVTVAHRLSTVRHCDEVVYVEAGRIVARGSFEEVRLQSTNFDQQARLSGL